MPVCTDVNKKYLREYAGGIEVLIQRSGMMFNEKISYRLNGGLAKSMIMAIELRDKKHIEMFGFPVTKGFFHVAKKTESRPLPSGISLGYSRGKLLYIVASWMHPEENKVKRERFNIKKLGYEKAISEAVEFRTKKINENHILRKI
jgi:hypothetical protein